MTIRYYQAYAFSVDLYVLVRVEGRMVDTSATWCGPAALVVGVAVWSSLPVVVSSICVTCWVDDYSHRLCISGGSWLVNSCDGGWGVVWKLKSCKFGTTTAVGVVIGSTSGRKFDNLAFVCQTD